MKKFWVIMLSAVLLSTSVSARPHGGFHPRSPRHEKVVVRHKGNKGRNQAFVAGVVGGIVGGLLWGNRYEQSTPQPVYVSVPSGPQVCSTAVVNGVVVQNCSNQPAGYGNVVYF